MQKLTLDMAQPGMVLARPVARPDGVQLVGEGAELTDVMLDRFDMAGVTELFVEGDDSADGGNGACARMAGRLEHLFRKQGDDRFMVILRNMLQQHLVRKAAATGSGGNA